MNQQIDEMKTWYEGADQISKTNLPRKGDTIIYPKGEGFTIEVLGVSWGTDVVVGDEPVRILEYFRGPRPEWCNEVAIMADYQTYVYEERLLGALINTGDDEWRDEYGAIIRLDDINSAVPLREYQVTDVMVRRLVGLWNNIDPENVIGIDYAHDSEQARRYLEVALGV